MQWKLAEMTWWSVNAVKLEIRGWKRKYNSRNKGYIRNYSLKNFRKADFGRILLGVECQKFGFCGQDVDRIDSGSCVIVGYGISDNKYSKLQFEEFSESGCW